MPLGQPLYNARWFTIPFFNFNYFPFFIPCHARNDLYCTSTYIDYLHVKDYVLMTLVSIYHHFCLGTSQIFWIQTSKWWSCSNSHSCYTMDQCFAPYHVGNHEDNVLPKLGNHVHYVPYEATNPKFLPRKEDSIKQPHFS